MRGQEGEAELKRAFAQMTQEGQMEPASPLSGPNPSQRWHLVAEDGSTSPLQGANQGLTEQPASKGQQVDMPEQPLVQLFGSDDGAASPPECFVACPLSVEKGVPVGRGAKSRPSIAMPLPVPRLPAGPSDTPPSAGALDSRTGCALPAHTGQTSHSSAGNPRWTADAQLNEVVRAWSRLSAEIRNAVVSMIRSARGG
jgi:hypothetical protein